MTLAYRTKKSVGAVTKKEVTPSGIRPPKFIVGEELEYRAARLFIFMGYFVRRGCPIYTVANLDQATDLDVFALKYTQPFRRESIVSECKSGEVGPLDRIFWLSGVKQFVAAKEALLVRRATKWNIKDFAKNTGVQIVDVAKIEELETNYRIGANEWPGVADRNFYLTHVADWNKSLVDSPSFWELYQTLITEIRYDDPFAGINYLLFQLRRLTKQFRQIPTSVLHRFLITESLSQLSVFLMRIAEVAFDLLDKDRDAYILKGLTYGSLDPKFAERILNSAYTITRQAVLHVTNKPLDIDRSFFQMPVPPGAENIRFLVNVILREYPLSLTFPQVTDLLLREVILKQNRSGGWLKRIFPSGDVSHRLELTRNYLKVLVDAEACPRAFIDELQVNTTENGIKNEAQASPIPEPTPKPSSLSNHNVSDIGTIPASPNENGESSKPLQKPEQSQDEKEFTLKPPNVK
ncbi:MAG TPA: hypothetical protein VG759_18060 [Candidatus Angelobacter sp.]|jgi:hypothetical protein|nr:hypothetical protein [Candidatus Angelobacter sp.]